MTDDGHIDRLNATARRDKKRRAEVMSKRMRRGPSPPSFAQREMLWTLLGAPSPASLEAYVRFANGYDYREPQTMMMWSEAITLAKEGFNSFGFAAALCDLSSEPDLELEIFDGEMKRRTIARMKAIKAQLYSVATKVGSVKPSKAPARALAIKAASDDAPKTVPSRKPVSVQEARAAQLQATMDALAKRRER